MADQLKRDAVKHPEGGWHNGTLWLTLAERQELTRKANENVEYFKKTFAHLRPKPEE